MLEEEKTIEENTQPEFGQDEVIKEEDQYSQIKTPNHRVVDDIESQIRNGHFQSKDELFEKLVELRNNGMMDEIDNRKMRELLDLYDKLQVKESPIDMQNFSSVSTENANLIISKQTDRVIKTDKDAVSFGEEFKQEQNELSSQSTDGLTNANRIFESLSNKKIEMSLVSLEEAILSNAISIEILNKIRFFIASSYVNPQIVRVDIEKGIFYNIETSEIYEVIFNPNTQEFEIYKNHELDYTESGLKKEQEKQQEKNKPKVRTLKKDDSPYLNSAAFTKISFLILNVISIGLLITMTILLNK